jgi:hypothetical protein
MKLKNTLFLFAGVLAGAFAFSSCSDLDTSPGGQISSENWYADEFELENSVDFLFKKEYWFVDRGGMQDFGAGWDGDFVWRDQEPDVISGTLNGQSGVVNTLWNQNYQAIGICNSILEHASNAVANGARQEFVNDIIGETRFVRAEKYAELVTKWGDVPFVTQVITPEDAAKLARTNKDEIKQWVYDEYDAAADLMYKDFGLRDKRAVKATAYAFKSRFALYMGDWAIAADAAKKCMDLGTFTLYPDYGELFEPSTHMSSETILAWLSQGYAYSTEGEYLIPRNLGGRLAGVPSWDLLATYVCTDGLPIDESPLFDPHNPFENRDPRCTYTIVPFTREEGSNHLGFEFHPFKDSVKNYSTGGMYFNNDSRINQYWASFTGLCMKKWITTQTLDYGKHLDNDFIIMRYAEVLLNYAEAKIEMNEIDQSVIDAMNMVRARAYKVDKSETSKYPAFTIKDQATMRRQVRVERHMEFAIEGNLYQDFVRWGWMEKIGTSKAYIMLNPMSPTPEDPQSQSQKNYEKLKECFFWPYAPDIDEDGIPDFTKMEREGYCQELYQRKWDKTKEYLWPIPTTEIEINPNLTQNPGY